MTECTAPESTTASTTWPTEVSPDTAAKSSSASLVRRLSAAKLFFVAVAGVPKNVLHCPRRLLAEVAAPVLISVLPENGRAATIPGNRRLLAEAAAPVIGNVLYCSRRRLTEAAPAVSNAVFESAGGLQRPRRR